MLISGVFGLLFGIIAVIGAYFFGTVLTGDVDPTILRIVHSVAAGIFGFTAFMIAIRMVQKVSLPSNTDGLLTTVPHLDAVVGIIVAEMAKIISIPALFVLAAAVTFGIGTGSVISSVLFAISVLSLVLLGALFGFVIGFGILNLLSRSPTLSRYRTVIGGLFFVAYLAVVYNMDSASAIEPVIQVISALPIGWFGDLALFAVLADASLVRAVGAVLIAVVGIPTAVVCCSWLAAQFWYTLPVEPAAEEDEPSKMSGMSVGSVPLPVICIIRKAWIRARRSPIRLVYVLYPLFVLFPFIETIIGLRSVPPAAPPLIALYGAWATGSAFTLNPIGDEGDVLPITLTSSINGRTFINGLCLAGLTIGLPVTVIAVLMTGVLASLSIVSLVSAVVAAAVLCVCATTIAAGAGTAFPRLEPAQVTRGRKAIVPSIFAFALFSIVFTIVSTPAVVGLMPAARDPLTDLIGIGTQTLVVGGLVSTILLGGVVSAISYYSAVGSFDSYYYE
jgi:ABC-2 type transport system permease protein